MSPVVLAVLEGVLYTLRGGTEIGRETWRDDGKVLTSEVQFAGREYTVAVERAPRRVTFTVGETKTVRDVPPDTIVLANGAWQQYGLAAEWFPGAHQKPIKILVNPDTIVDGTLDVRHTDIGNWVVVKIGPLEVRATLPLGVLADPKYEHVRRITGAEVPAQGLTVKPEPPPLKMVHAPWNPAPGIDAQPFQIERSGVKLAGEVWKPSTVSVDAKWPLVILIAGSGPTDRDGNSHLGVKADVYKMIAEGLARRGVASLRYDKRGVGESGFGFDITKLTIDDFVEDAAVLVEHARKDHRFSSVTLVGHSEGALIATLLARRAKVDGLVLLAGGGRTFATILREQLGRQLDEKQLAELDRHFAALRTGAPFTEPSATVLKMIFRPELRTFLKSELDLDPAALLRDVKVKTAIVQGETDAQISVEDARRLAAARPDAKLVLLRRANHLFKEEASRALPQASYTDPSRPLVPGLVEAIAAVAAP